MVLHGIDSSSGAVSPLQSTGRKLHMKSSELETKLDTINTTLGDLNVNIGDVEVNVADLEALQAITNTKLDTVNTSVGGVSTAVGGVSTAVGGVESKIDALIAANHVDLVAVSDATDGIETLLTNLDTAQDLTNTKLTQVVSNTAGGAIVRNANNSWISGVLLGVWTRHSTPLDQGTTYKTVHLHGSSSSGSSAWVMGSHDNVSWYGIKEMYPQSFDTAFHYYCLVKNAPRYVTVSAGPSSDTFTFAAEQQSF